MRSIHDIEDEAQAKREAEQRQQQEQSDYKRMYETILAENKQLRERLGEIETQFGEGIARIEETQGKFAALEAKMAERYSQLLEMSEAMQEMVSSGYKQQTDTMERFRGDISQRLDAAKESPTETRKNNG